MESLLLYSEMESSYPPAWFEKVPSPTGSDDSGLGWAPSPNDSDRRFQVESPGQRYVVFKGFTEEASPPAYNYGDQKSFLSQLGPPDVKNNTKLDNQSPVQQKSFAPEIERYIGDLLEPFSNNLSKSCSKSNNKKKNSTTDASLSYKLERCLQPKTGNGKPRQTSTKRKMSQKPKPKSTPYPGVRVPTVRQRLDQLKKEKKEKESAQAKHTALNFTAPLSDGYTYTDIPQGAQLYHGEPATTRHTFSPVEASPADILPENLAVPDDLVDAPVTAFQQISPMSSPRSSCSQQLLSQCDQMVNVASPPNVTLSASMQQQFVPSPTGVAEQRSPNAYFDAQQATAYSTNQSYMSSPTYYSTSQSEPSPMMKATPSPSFSFPTTYPDAINQSVATQPMYQTSSPIQQISEQTQAYTSLHDIAAVGNVPLLRAHLSVKPDLAGLKDNSGLLPISHAIKNNQLEVVRLLLSDTPHTYTTPEGATVLHEAAALPNPAVLNLILSALQDWEIKEIINRKCGNPGGFTALHIAAQAGHAENMALLLKYGADVLAKAHGTLYSPLHIAIKNADKSAIQVLVEFAKSDFRPLGFGAALSKQDQNLAIKGNVGAILICQQDRNKNTPLHFAADLQSMYGNDISVMQLQTFVIRYLLENGADPAAMNVEYKTPSQHLPPVDSSPQARELHSLLLNVPHKVADINVKRSPGYMEAGISAFNFNSSPIHQGSYSQLPGSKGPFFQ